MTVPKSNKSLAHPLQFLALGFVIFAGIAGGMYVGTAWSHRFRDLTPESAQNDSFYELGEEIPNYKLWDVNTREDLHVRDLLARGPALLVFVREDCDYCKLMMEFWKRKVVSDLRSDIQIVLVYDDKDFSPEVTGSYKLGNLVRGRIVTTDREAQHEEDGIIATPTVIGVGTDSRIQFVVSGFNRDVSFAFINQNL